MLRRRRRRAAGGLMGVLLRIVVCCLLPAWGAMATSSAASAAVAPAPVAPAPTSAYWMAGSDGSVYAFGAPALGPSTPLRPVAPIVGMAATPTGRGYWLAAADGAVFSFGDARFQGSTNGQRIDRPIVGMASTPSGNGYWLVAADGGIFAFGDALFYGSTGGKRLDRPIVGMASAPSGNGYWLVAADGGIFAFGLPFFGSMGGLPLHRPVVGMAAGPSEGGYWLVADDGGIFAFGLPFFGSTGGMRLNRPISALTPSPTGAGYTMVARDGGVFSFGDARFAGSTAGLTLGGAIVGLAVEVEPRPYVPGQRGYDISWPQCGKPYPARPFEIAIVGVNNGHPLSTNPCLVDQATRWAGTGQLDVYLNLNRPPVGYTGGCLPTDATCIALAFGSEAVQTSVATVRAAGLAPRLWWLDVEGPATWATDTALNALVIQAAVDALQDAGRAVGIYGTRFQWTAITGGYSTRTPLPVWAAGVTPLQRCNEPFAGGYVVLSQVIGEVTASGFDENIAC